MFSALMAPGKLEATENGYLVAEGGVIRGVFPVLPEQYAGAGAPYGTDGATWLAETGSFSFELDDGVLTVSCDAGTARATLRSQVEGVAS